MFRLVKIGICFLIVMTLLNLIFSAYMDDVDKIIRQKKPINLNPLTPVPDVSAIMKTVLQFYAAAFAFFISVWFTRPKN